MVGSEASWKPDPLGRYKYRWWTGAAWTDQVHLGTGDSLVDPLGLRPGPLAAGPLPTGLNPVLPAASTPGLPPGPDSTLPPGSTSGLPAGSPSASWSPMEGSTPASGPNPAAGFGAPAGAPAGYGAQVPASFGPQGGAGYQYPPNQYGQIPSQLVVTNANKAPGVVVAALVLGVCSLCVALIPFFGLLSLPFSLAGFLLGIVGLTKAKKGFEGHGMAMAGVITSGLALIIPFLWLLVFATAFDDSIDSLDRINSDVSNGICDDSRYLEDPDC